MYLDYWKLECLPFENAPDSRFFYESQGHKEGVLRLLFSIQSKKAIALVTGEYGCGKTLLCRTVIKRLPQNEYRTALITNPRMDSLDITREIAYQFGEDIQTRSKYDVLHAFNNLIDRHAAAGRHCVAIIDEAQLITDPYVFEDLRLLINHQDDGEFKLTLIFVGQTELKHHIRPIPQMAQRIGLKFHISHLMEDEIKNYILFRLKVAGATTDIFTENAIKLIADVSKGNPREINALADLSLLHGSFIQASQIDETIITDVAKERG